MHEPDEDFRIITGFCCNKKHDTLNDPANKLGSCYKRIVTISDATSPSASKRIK